MDESSVAVADDGAPACDAAGPLGAPAATLCPPSRGDTLLALVLCALAIAPVVVGWGLYELGVLK